MEGSGHAHVRVPSLRSHKRTGHQKGSLVVGYKPPAPQMAR
jgi:hypothetical protein